METKEEESSNVEGQRPKMSLESHQNLKKVRDSSSSKGGGDDKGQIGSRSSTFEFHFPEEVWEIILNELTEDEDRTNCCRAFPLFHRLLTKSKPVWMFKQILPFVDDALCDNDKLTCRRICKQWRTDIEGSITNLKRQWYFFDSVEKIDSFIQTFKGHPCNPFIDRTFDIYTSGGDEAPEFFCKILDLLSTFGKYVWILEFWWPNPEVGFDWNIPNLASYQCLQQVLTKTPNLKQLYFFTSSVAHVEDLDNDYHQTLSLHMADNPLPAIPTLESLETYGLPTDALPLAFISTLVSPYALHLQDIRIEWGSCDQVFSHQFPKLILLQLDEVPGDQGLEKLLQLTAPLKALEIGGPAPDSDNNGSFISIPGLVRVFNNFPLLEDVSVYDVVETRDDFSHLTNSTVQKLRLRFWDIDDADDGNDDNPHLRRRLGLPVSFNFLQVFKGLQELDVTLRSPTETYFGRNEGEGEVQLCKAIEEGQLYESNIWTLIPSLKTVTIYCGKDKKTIFGERKELEKRQASRRAIRDYRVDSVD